MKPYLFGLGLGTVGWLVGAATMGAALNESCETEDLGCTLQALLIGGAVLGTAGLALGVHLGNGSEGNYLLDFVTGAGIWLLGVGPIVLADFDVSETQAWLTFIGVPILQLVLVDKVDRARIPDGTESAGLHRGPAVHLGAMPVAGRPGFGLRISF